MKVVVLCENTSNNPQLKPEHGLSLYLELDDIKILFDMGQSDIFIENAKKLDIDLSQVDIAILSHGHYDHGGGLQAFLNINNKAKVYMNQRVFDEYYHGKEKYIGLDQRLKDDKRIIFVEDEYQINDMCTLYTCNKLIRPYPTNPYGLLKKKDDNFVDDDFHHEQYLIIKENNKDILISGCSHKGILNIMEWFRPDICIGGFHFKAIDLDEQGIKTINKASEILSTYQTMYYTLHCTGYKQYELMKKIMGNSLEYISTGDTLVI